MPVVTLEQLRAALPKGKRLMGIDQSKRALGLAVSDPDLSVATPLRTLLRTKFSHDAHVLAGICKEYNIGGFIIGLPLNMDESAGPRVDSVKHFADNLVAAKDVLGFDPLIAFFDERLSTYAAEDLMAQHTKLSPRERAAIIDQLAAQIVLQEALDKIKTL